MRVQKKRTPQYKRCFLLKISENGIYTEGSFRSQEMRQANNFGFKISVSN
jgi:hypothetical protein